MYIFVLVCESDSHIENNTEVVNKTLTTLSGTGSNGKRQNPQGIEILESNETTLEESAQIKKKKKKGEEADINDI